MRREIATYLPAQVRGISGQSVADAQAEIPAADIETQVARNPFSKTASRVVESGCSIRAGFIGTDGRPSLVPVFTGRVMDAGGSALTDVMSVDCDDDAALLRRDVIVAPLASQMRYVPDSGASVLLFPGVSGSYVMDSVLRQLGYYTMPAAEPSTAVSCPLQGTVWPEQLPAGTSVSATAFYGELIQARNGVTEDNPTFVSQAWDTGERFLALTGDFVFRVRPARLVETDWVRIHGWANGESGQTEILLQSAGLAWTRVRIRPGEIEVAINTLGTPTHTFTGWPGGRFSIDVEHDGATNNVILFYEGGSQSTSLVGAHSNGVSYVQVTSEEGMALAGVAVRSNPSGAHAMIGFVPSASLDPTIGRIDATPGLFRDNGWDALREVAEAELGAVWLDEQGTPTFRNRQSLRGIGEPVHEITSRTSLMDVSWREAVEQVRSSVQVPVLPVTSYLSDDYAHTVWSAQETGTVISVGANATKRLSVNLNGIAIGIDTTATAGTGSTGTRFRANTAADGSGSDVSTSVQVEVDPSGPRVARVIVTNNHSGRVWLVAGNGSDAPDLFIRARQRIIQASQASEYAEVDNEGVRAEELTLDESPYVQDNSSALDLASFLAAELSAPRAILQRVPVLWEPRRQLGDIVEISDPDVTGLEPLRGVVVAIEHGGTAGNIDQYIDVRPLLPTIAEFNQAWDGQTIADLNALWDGQTIADFNADPLRVS
ncbi:hypothetical protein [Jiangella asiatica]|uniref:Uncharacterized protein n=1 Tax=Jiangella asiatica TaxID=2530372 RepID=A0A4V2Z0Z7_9ACTN|nr:hypothetical protein [Jiangella asiatica]TDE02828.1 hypothetical protein E1269_21290 [Jiangella asiatica]